MSRSTNHTEKVQVAGYGVHYYASSQLIRKATDQIVYQTLIDIVRKQLAKSLDNQTIMLNQSELSRKTNIERGHTLTDSFKRLEKLGLLKRYDNALLINCDEYVTLVRLYEALPTKEKEKLAKDFAQKGIEVLKDYNVCVKLHSREELLGMSGSSIVVNSSELGNFTQSLTSEGKNCVELHNDVCKITQFGSSESKNCVELHSASESIILHAA